MATDKDNRFCSGENLAVMQKGSNIISKITELSRRGLDSMYDQRTHLFCYRVKRKENGLENEGISRRYTIISLLGLHKYEIRGGVTRIDIKNSICSLMKDIDKIDNIGDLGLLLWLLAVASPEHVKVILEGNKLGNCFIRYPDARVAKTVEMAWFLTGLSHIRLAGIAGDEGLESIAKQTYLVLRKNYGGRGIFGHMSKYSLAGRFRGRIGCFADQVYPIYAFSKFGQAFDMKEAVEIAKKCGQTMCELQGPMGQWWWHYDAITGRVIGRYPVYSVHQDGMAPMALFALSSATGSDFTGPVLKGLEWITGQNELRTNMVDSSQHVIWRSIRRPGYKMRLEEAQSLLGMRSRRMEPEDLSVLYECRPYHLGWLLYAFAGGDKVR